MLSSNNQQQPNLSPTAAAAGSSSSSSPTDQQQHHHHHHFFHMHSTNERFRILEDGTHEHHLSGPAQNRLTSSINDFVDGLFHRESARSLRLWGGDRRMSPEELQEERDAIDASLNRTTTPETCLAQKWGVTQEVIGKGAFGKIRVIRRDVQQQQPSSSSSAAGDGEQQLFAVKEFRRKGSETLKSYVRRLVSEYDISSALQHRHIVATFDLLPLTETSSTYCLVMEYCEGGDLFELIFESSDGLATAEANCFFKQLLQGVAFLHSVGIAHRDIKPENLLLTPHGCLKISDFGSSVYIGARGDQEEDGDAMHYCKGIVGSEPYIAPEQFVQSSYDGRRADVWSCAVVYVAMATGSHLWHVARQGEDDDYDRFLRFRQLLDSERQRVKQMHNNNNNHLDPAEIQRAREVIRRRAREDGCDMLTGLEFGAKKLVYRMLDPSPCKRPSIAQILDSPWATNVWSCQPAHST
ncbi:serine threonine protein [Lichtheimia corymbifera JMRC:FSU:9682]|uniref:non-specific serine/threonine protein kinase n=1 Tax=Lichtheimia corymbifera JMRC:FSU:9682 TaxID=1263082 RepID=A0A068SE70_9FUNG|nr:serine threonine protein [Lichtheimia corymbifera JMRC:FSU:9682]